MMRDPKEAIGGSDKLLQGPAWISGIHCQQELIGITIAASG